EGAPSGQNLACQLPAGGGDQVGLVVQPGAVGGHGGGTVAVHRRVRAAPAGGPSDVDAALRHAPAGGAAALDACRAGHRVASCPAVAVSCARAGGTGAGWSAPTLAMASRICCRRLPSGPSRWTISTCLVRPHRCSSCCRMTGIVWGA